MYPLDSLLHLSRIILLSESLKDLIQCLWRWVDLLNFLILLLSLFFKLIFSLFLSLHYRLLNIIHHLIRLWNGAVIVVDRHDLALLFTSRIHVDDASDLHWLMFDHQSTVQEVVMVTEDWWLVVRGVVLALRLLLDRTSPHWDWPVEVLITKVVVKIWKRVIKGHHKVLFICKGLLEKHLV
jgi:hypothetical protein